MTGLPIGNDSGDFDIETILKESCPYAAIILLGTFFGDPPRVEPGVLFTTAQLYELTSSFSGVPANRATLTAANGSFATEICGDDPQSFTLIVNFQLPPGATLSESRSSARPDSIPDQDYNVSAFSVEMDSGQTGHMNITARRRCCPAANAKPGIQVRVGCTKAGQIGVCDARAVVRILC